MNFWERLPKRDQNNIWHKFDERDLTVFVFVHGIFSDSRNCWLSGNESSPSSCRYWPEMLAEDARFDGVSIFLGGFYTAVDSGPFDAQQASKALFAALKREISPGSSVLSFKNIIFLCHSTGGIVTRHMLYHQREAFKQKTVGLVLIASPSYGAKWANRLDLLARFYNNTLAKQLQWKSSDLKALDGNFRDLIKNKFIPKLIGTEAVENHFVAHWKWCPIFSRTILVDEESGARYFGSVTVLPGTDHFTSVKPCDAEHPAYTFLLDFYLNEFQTAARGTSGGNDRSQTEVYVSKICREIKVLRGDFEGIGKEGDASWREVNEKASTLGDQLRNVSDVSLSGQFKVLKYEYAAYAYTLAASVEPAHEKRARLSSISICLGQLASEEIAKIKVHASGGDLASIRIQDWLNRSRDADRILYFLAVSHAINLRAGGSSKMSDVKNCIDIISSQFMSDYPPQDNPELAAIIKEAANVNIP